MAEGPHDRRSFFREVLKRYVVPAAEYVEDRLETVQPRPRRMLRPPGAIPEGDFLSTCHRCGACIEACPAHAIRPLKTEDVGRADTPVVDAEQQPCVVCDELACMQVCPSGALEKLTRDQIRMGLAKVDPEICVRSKGEDCSVCVDLCPIGKKAIELNEIGQVTVWARGCVGCGVCQYECPTSPKAITVEWIQGENRPPGVA
ncbi:MAG: 4Fe-4S dicluster domain-containing protein [bacterium]|nr:4Fe-4S dicluster domain-containing protein [bacterium]